MISAFWSLPPMSVKAKYGVRIHYHKLNFSLLNNNDLESLDLQTGRVIAVNYQADPKVFHVETAKYSDFARRGGFGGSFLP
jgi:hypothetical protein